MKTEPNKLVEKVANGYSNKFCNAIGIGVSQDGALKMTIAENKSATYNPSLWLDIAISGKDSIDKVDQNILLELVAKNVVNKCGYPIGLEGSEGVEDFRLRLEEALSDIEE
ncbi:hypothetical protein [Prochlorococcus sp. MIT 1300]|uniref:hypothetical protein n=1 Tax=Prochlorococcus sp. MIT 1300 TaxID=3096218 RepID=UPI002A74D6F5|nr:hypothetical protein [Prochlorococcus sp. MIT 1300]